MRFDWTDLQLFVHACEAGSLTGAAQRAHLTLAAVSARMRELESQSGAPLLERHSRGVRPTGAGRALERHARAVLEQVAQLKAEVGRHGTVDAQPLRLLANTSALSRLVAGPVGAFLARPGNCAVQVEESASHLTAQALREGLADAGILSDAAGVAGLETRALGEDPLVAVLPRGHALAARPRLAFAEALAFDWVGSGAAGALHTHLAMQAQRLGLPMKLRASIGDLGAVQALVSRGAGIAVLPKALLHPQARELKLVTRPLTDAWARRRLLLCTGGGPRRPALQALLDCF